MIFLVGMMGCGKTSLGRALAKELGFCHVDLDAEIEKSAGMPISQLVEAQGMEHFRDMESRALKALMAHFPAKTVVSTGGGTVLREENVRVMGGQGTIVYIERDAAAVFKDLDTESRPLLRNDPSQWTAIYESRRAIYETSADICFQNTYESAAVGARALAELLAGRA